MRSVVKLSRKHIIHFSKLLRNSLGGNPFTGGKSQKIPFVANSSYEKNATNKNHQTLTHIPVEWIVINPRKRSSMWRWRCLYADHYICSERGKTRIVPHNIKTNKCKITSTDIIPQISTALLQQSFLSNCGKIPSISLKHTIKTRF